MSSEQIINNKSLKTSNNIDLELNKFVKSPIEKVDINKLFSKMRQKQNKQKKENFVFLSLIGLVVVTTGLIASL